MGLEVIQVGSETWSRTLFTDIKFEPWMMVFLSLWALEFEESGRKGNVESSMAA